MNKVILSLCLLLTITNFINCQVEVAAANPTAKNYCDNKYCGECGYVAAANAKSCTTCAFSVKKLVAGVAGVYECVERNSISNCAAYYSAEESDAGCRGCNSNYYKKLKTGTSKPTYECVAATIKITNIANCAKTVSAGTFEA